MPNASRPAKASSSSAIALSSPASACAMSRSVSACVTGHVVRRPLRRALEQSRKLFRCHRAPHHASLIRQFKLPPGRLKPRERPRHAPGTVAELQRVRARNWHAAGRLSTCPRGAAAVSLGETNGQERLRMINGQVSHWWERAGRPIPRPELPGSITADVAIVGAGYTGSWAAYYLKESPPRTEDRRSRGAARWLRRIWPQRRLAHELGDGWARAVRSRARPRRRRAVPARDERNCH